MQKTAFHHTKNCIIHLKSQEIMLIKHSWQKYKILHIQSHFPHTRFGLANPKHLAPAGFANPAGAEKPGRLSRQMRCMPEMRKSISLLHSTCMQIHCQLWQRYALFRSEAGNLLLSPSG